MMEQEREQVQVPKDSLNIERLALMAVIGLLSWNVYTTNQLSLSQVRTEEQILGLRNQITLATNNIVDPADYAVDYATTRTRLDRYESWLTRLSDRINALETARDDKL